MADKENFLNFPHRFIHGSGLWPSSPKYTKIICICFLLPMSLIVDICVIYDFHSTNLGDQITKTADLLESTSSFGQLLVRKFILIAHGKLIQDVMQEREQFWNYDMFGEEYGIYLRCKMTRGINAIKILTALGSVLAFLICLTSVLDEKKTPLESWTFENASLNWVLFVMQAVSFTEILYLVCAVDAFYVLVCTDIRIQFLLLQTKLKAIQLALRKDKQCLADLITCTKLHSILLRVHKKVNKIFGKYFVAQYILSILATSPQFYILIYITPNLEDMLKSICYLAAVFFQVAMFFIPASDVEAESEKFAAEIYNINWELTSNRKIRKQVLFMMMRAQQPLVMLGEGMIHVNRREYIVLFRLAFSISTLLGGMNDSERSNK